jgi:hypothetical protein
MKKTMLFDHLTHENIDAQFCSNWLKAEMKLLFTRISELEKERDNLKQILYHTENYLHTRGLDSLNILEEFFRTKLK